MRSVLIALFTFGAVSVSTPVASAPSAPTAKAEASMEHRMPHGWRLYVYGSPPQLCSMMKVMPPWGLTLMKTDRSKPWLLQITNVSWLIPGPAPIKFEFKFGDEPSWDQTGQSVNFHTVQTAVGQEFIIRWKAHNTLKVKINGSEINFSLLGTANGTKTLEQCVSGLSMSRECGPDCS